MQPFRVALPVADKRVVVVGGGPVAMPYVAGLRDAGARIDVIGAEVTDTLEDLAQRGHIRLLRRQFEAADLADAWLVVAATNDAGTDAQVRRLADEERIWCLEAKSTSAESVGEGGRGRVVLVGGGPGDPGLLTVAGMEALRRADVVVVDRLAPVAALAEAPPQAEIIDVAKIPRGQYTPQDVINKTLISQAQQGKYVVRLKGGDNFVFGRGGEEWQACAEAGVAVDVIPGVTSSIAVPAMAGVPVTHRSLTQGFSVVSGHVPPDHPSCMLDWSSLAQTNTTLVILMGLANLAAIADKLVSSGLPATTPAATIADGGLPTQLVVRAELSSLATAVDAAGLRAPVVTVIGAVAGFDPEVRR
ncbi:uroporphyrin-III C-methyltransferase/precorrin-2 dehydrogenase/sirohydrochlorin ferrochelatase/uroporphyrin-III C-methyltransferase [Antricoccus suffuscus]|uniref:uroporphyrinogen-III C-methyltransferase n=1 Tax=Antricoccus suffuscus TaxID=1629062 RepID=A0A2T0ZZG7_9ACTN|nr:uroporphyrinogen-III C-methyltransferase [Antricoccus suffuscus]PRZ41742.1 uroporphyrin-III C-methyltransferase/precorrin-2 dehydrogenase/sirohydrochlorin ferrochelatase/uroporphyrin-III C-methyltransferase [Antricoccus suffuscus]